MAYAGSLISQNFGETDLDHGVLVWDLLSGCTTFHRIHNPYGFFDAELTKQGLVWENKVLSLEKKSILQQHLPEYCHLRLKIKLEDQKKTYQFMELFRKERPLAKVQLDYQIEKKKTMMAQDNINVEEGNRWIRSYILTKLEGRCDLPMIEKIIEEITQTYCNFIQFGDINNPSWELESIRFDDMFGYGKNKCIELKNLYRNTVTGIFGKNSFGKSTIIDIITFLLFGKITRLSHGNSIPKEVIHQNEKKSRGELIMKVGNKKYKIVKDCVRMKNEKIRIHESMYVWEQEDWKNMTEEHRKKTDKIIESLVGNYESFVFTNICLQQKEKVFREMTQKERKEFMYQLFGLNSFDTYRKEKEEILKGLRGEEKVYKEKCGKENMESCKQKIIELENDIALESQNLVECHEKQEELEIQIEKIHCQLKKCLIDTCEHYEEKKREISQSISEHEKKINLLLRHQAECNEFLNKQSKRDLEIKKEEVGKIIHDLETIQWNENEKKYLVLSHMEWTTFFKKVKNRIQHSEEITNTWRRKEDEIQQQIQDYKSSLHEIDQGYVSLNEYSNLKTKINKILMDIPILEEKCKKEMKEIEPELDLILEEYYDLRKRFKMKECEVQVLKSNMKEICSIEFNESCRACMQNPFYVQKSQNQKNIDILEDHRNELNEKSKHVLTKIRSVWNFESPLPDCDDKIEEEMRQIIQKYKQERIEFYKKKGLRVKKLEHYLHQKKIFQSTEKYHENAEKSKKIKELENLLQQDPLCIEFNLLMHDIQNYGSFEKINTYHQNNYYSLDIEMMRSQYKEIETELLNYEKKENELVMMEEKLRKTEKKLFLLEIDLKKWQEEWEIYQYNLKYKKDLVDVQLERKNMKDKITHKTSNLEKLKFELQKNLEHKKIWDEDYESLSRISLQMKHLELMIDCIDRDGLPLYLLKMYLPLLEKEMNFILENFMDKNIVLQVVEKELYIGLKDKKSETITNYFGGMESFIVDLTMKLILSKFSKLPRSNFFIIDEGISVFDQERISNIHVLFDFLSSLNDHVFLISHILTIKDFVTQFIEVQKDPHQKSFLNFLI